MLVKDILETTEQFPTVATDDTCQRAAQLMDANDVRALAVVESEHVKGIVTDWDIVHAFAAFGDELGERPVSSVMTSDGLITIDVDASVADATALIAESRVHHLPVVSSGKYQGMLCLGLEWSEEGMLTPPVRPTLTARHP